MVERPRISRNGRRCSLSRGRFFGRGLSRTISNIEDVKQLVRASGSVTVNCIEANEALGDKDRLMRFWICRKEAKECQLWLRLVHTGEAVETIFRQKALRQEAHELKLIFSRLS